jgi:hypothetical protein
VAELVFLEIKYAHWPVLKERLDVGLFGKIRHITYSATIEISIELPVKHFIHVMGMGVPTYNLRPSETALIALRVCSLFSSTTSSVALGVVALEEFS